MAKYKMSLGELTLCTRVMVRWLCYGGGRTAREGQVGRQTTHKRGEQQEKGRSSGNVVRSGLGMIKCQCTHGSIYHTADEDFLGETTTIDCYVVSVYG